MSKFYETTFTFKVLSEYSIADCDLSLVIEQCNQGDLVGMTGKVKETILTPKVTASKLITYGSEPGFFCLEDDGKPIK